MNGMLKAEVFKFKHSYALWIILGVISASCAISVITGTYNSAEQALTSIAKDCMVPILACAIYSAVILTEDFSNGILRQYIAHGYARSSIVTAKFIHYISGCSILIFAYFMICVSLSAVMQGVETYFMAVIGEMLAFYVKSLPLYWGILGLFFLFSVLIQKGVVAAGVSVAASILLAVFTNKLYSGSSSVLRYSPLIQIGEIANRTAASGYLVSALLSLVILAACLFAGIEKFNHDEL